MTGGRRRNHAYSPYQAMWLFAFFDLPVDTADHRRAYARFRKALLAEGFTTLQFSVYARHCQSEERADAIKRRLRIRLPNIGHVRLLSVTDAQFGKMEVFEGIQPLDPEQPPLPFEFL
jgi:CRISPR-associated protein Cas2